MTAGAEMAKKIKEVDAYIEQAPNYAKPILKKLRKAFHRGCPEIEESIKWGVPHFQFHGIVGGMAAFKEHVSFGFWKSKLMSDPAGILGNDPSKSMCNTKIASTADLPTDEVLEAYVAEAAKLNAEGKKLPTVKKSKKPPPEVPIELARALRQSPKARVTFERFPPSHQHEYVEWIVEAKQETTRQRRVAQAIEWLEEGKSRNWKYERKQ